MFCFASESNTNNTLNMNQISISSVTVSNILCTSSCLGLTSQFTSRQLDLNLQYDDSGPNKDPIFFTSQSLGSNQSLCDLQNWGGGCWKIRLASFKKMLWISFYRFISSIPMLTGSFLPIHLSIPTL